MDHNIEQFNDPNIERRTKSPIVDRAEKVVGGAVQDMSPARLNLFNRLSRVNKTVVAAAIVGVLLTSGCGNIPFSSTHAETKQNEIVQTIPEAPTPQTSFTTSSSTETSPLVPPSLSSSTESTSNIRLLSLKIPAGEYIQVQFDKDQNPISYELPGRHKVDLNIDPQTAAELKQKAIRTNEAQLYKVIPIDVDRVGTTNIENDARHPIHKELPEGVLTKEQLKKRGIEIIKSDGIEFYIREGAFAKGALLEDYKDGSSAITIVLTKGSLNKIAVDPKFQKVKDKYYEYLKGRNAGRDPEVYRQAMINHAQRRMSMSGVTDEEVVRAKATMERYQHASQVTLMEELSGVRKFMEAGYYLGDDPDRVTIIASVGRDPANFNLIVYFDSKGKGGVTAVHFNAAEGNAPASWQSHPDPKWFTKDPNASETDPKSYAYGVGSTIQGNLPGFLVRHELAHNILIGRPGRAKPSQFKKPDGTLDIEAHVKASLSADYSEYHTDEFTEKLIREAWDKWVQSGLKDDSGYYFVLGLPDNKGYILN